MEVVNITVVVLQPSQAGSDLAAFNPNDFPCRACQSKLVFDQYAERTPQTDFLLRRALQGTLLRFYRRLLQLKL